MNDLQELIEAVQACGATIRAEGSDLKIRPAGVIPPDLKARLKEHKVRILGRLKLEANMKRQEAAGMNVTVSEVDLTAVMRSTVEVVLTRIVGTNQTTKVIAQNASQCWHCHGDLACDCIFCQKSVGAGEMKPQRCTVCFGTGFLAFAEEQSG